MDRHASIKGVPHRVAKTRRLPAVAVDVHHKVVRHPEDPAAVVLVPELPCLCSISLSGGASAARRPPGPRRPLHPRSGQRCRGKRAAETATGRTVPSPFRRRSGYAPDLSRTSKAYLPISGATPFFHTSKPADAVDIPLTAIALSIASRIVRRGLKRNGCLHTRTNDPGAFVAVSVPLRMMLAMSMQGSRSRGKGNTNRRPGWSAKREFVEPLN